MTVWIIEPRDPLIVRDGRPFHATPGARAVSLSFPFPSTTTGALRSRAGSDAEGRFVKDASAMLKIAVRGPLLVELDDDNHIKDWLFPAPADALLLQLKEGELKEGEVLRQRLLPLRLPDGAVSDFAHPDLALVGPLHPRPNKPFKEAPAYWNYATFCAWLSKPPDAEDPVEPVSLGHNGLTRESRIHIMRDSARGAAADGALFETEGLEFACRDNQRNIQRLALVIEATAETLPQSMVDNLGGERRLAVWRKAEGELPQCPAELKARIAHDKACRLILLTPACFEQGFHPRWLLESRAGMTTQLTAIAINRPQIVSGWDFAKKQPKASRRLAPAGSVFFLKLTGNDAAIQTWIDQTWMHCISDGEQDRRDGFGLAALGTWQP
jgi:CRISPR-associated protein Cmr3